MLITIIHIGSSNNLLQDIVIDYEKRIKNIGRIIGLKDIIYKEIKNSNKKNITEKKDEETKKLINQKEKGALNILLDIEGSKLNALVPYYYLPTIKNLEKESLSIGRNAYQLLYFGQIKESLNLAKLAVTINKLDEKLWLILSEAQIANKLYEEALISLKKAEKINPNLSEIFFSKSNIFIKQLKLKDAKIALKKALQIRPENHKAIFQLGNISV